MADPWEWYIYLHELVDFYIFMVNVGKYTVRPMDPMGLGFPIMINFQPLVLGGVGFILLMEEILNQLIGSLSHYSQGLIHLRWFSRHISEPSTVVGWDKGGVCCYRGLVGWI